MRALLVGVALALVRGERAGLVVSVRAGRGVIELAPAASLSRLACS
jgi:hypothetical protein